MSGRVENPPPDSPVKHRRKTPGFCDHKYVLLDTTKHKVFCEECDEEVDPFKVLDDLAHSWERYESAKRYAKSEAASAEKRLDELKAEIKKAKARLRTAKAKWEGDDYDQIVDHRRHPMPPI